ncbi:MAG: peptidoglycan-binding protein, partial [Desulfobacterales bacterium]|nr:peptidoglycan-binding protein [Desulfobacterales bacterium]
TLATYIHRQIEADHPPQPPAPGELPACNLQAIFLIGYTAEQEDRLQIAEVQAALQKLGYNVGKVDGKLGSKTRAAIKAFQKTQHLSVNGKITQKLLEQLKIAVESRPPADRSQPDRATKQ